MTGSESTKANTRIEPRPPMRAMYGVALFLHEEKKLDEALELFQALMVLKMNDNQGVRYSLATAAASKSNAMTNSRSYRGDVSASLLYTKALYFFRKLGASDKANKALLRLSATMFTCRFFFPRCSILPNQPPDRIGIGNQAEAIAYTLNFDESLIPSPWPPQLDGTGVSKAAPKDVH